MAYANHSNYPDIVDYNYQYSDQYNYNHDPRYVHHYSNTEFYENTYQHAPTPSLVGYYYSAYDQPVFYASKNANFQENGQYYNDPISTEYIVSYNSTTVEESDDIVEKEDAPKTFHGGYDITKVYGKPLPPSDDICHPPSKYDPKTPPLNDVNFGSIPSPYLKDDNELVSQSEPKKSTDGELLQKETALDFEDDEDDDEEEQKQDDNVKEAQNLEDEPNLKNGEITGGEDTKENEDEDEIEGEGVDEGGDDSGEEGIKEENYENEIRRQIPPGYGMEAYDICDGLFGGYFPCLWKRNQRIYNHQRDVNEKMSDYDYCGKESADFLFGNPNPYGGTMPEKGSYGDPVYMYQRHYPHQPVTVQVEDYGQWPIQYSSGFDLPQSGSGFPSVYGGCYSSYLQNSGNSYGCDG